MKSRHFRWLVTLLASLIGGGVVAGCGEEASWEHPNRQRYAAPPEQTDDAMSVEELQRAWKERDRQSPDQQQDQQQNQQQDQQVTRTQRQAADGQSANRDMLDLALDYLTGALDAVVTNAGGDQQVNDEHEALGGGPAPGARAPADNGSGEM